MKNPDYKAPKLQDAETVISEDRVPYVKRTILQFILLLLGAIRQSLEDVSQNAEAIRVAATAVVPASNAIAIPSPLDSPYLLTSPSRSIIVTAEGSVVVKMASNEDVNLGTHEVGTILPISVIAVHSSSTAGIVVLW